MQCYTHTLPGGASLVGYLREETTEMPAFNTRPAMLILPGGGYAYCSSREADPVAMQFLQAGYNVFILYYTCRGQESQPALRWQPLIDAAGAILHIRILRRPRQSCGTLSRFGRHSASAEKRPCPMLWCWATRSSPAANFGMTARSATSAVTMTPCAGR